MNRIFTQNDKELAIRYFLGKLSENERNQTEEDFFTDEDFSYFLDNAERDLIDNYVNEKLSANDKKLFETVYLNSAQRQEKLIFAKSLQAKFLQNESSKPLIVEDSPKTSWFNFFRLPNLAWASGLAIFLLMFVIFTGWFISKQPIEQAQSNTNIIDNSNIKPEVSATPQNNNSNVDLANNSNLSNANLTQKNTNLNKKEPVRNQQITNEANKKLPETNNSKQTEKKPISQPQPSLATLILLPLTRSADKPSITLNADNKQLMLKIVSDNAQEFTNFKLEIRNSSGGVISQQSFKNSSTKTSKTFLVNLPANKLSTDLYEATLIGIKPNSPPKMLNFYEFNLTKK